MAGIQKIIVILKEVFTLFMVTSTYYLKMKVKALTGKKSAPSGTLREAQFTLAAHRKWTGFRSCSETQHYSSLRNSGCGRTGQERKEVT